MDNSKKTSVTIHHLSDLHFDKGLEKFFFGAEKIQSDLGKMNLDRSSRYLELLEEENKPDIVIISGDLTYYGSKEEFDSAATFIRQIKERCPATTRFVIVPGNHDVEWDKIKPNSRFDDQYDQFYLFINRMLRFDVITPLSEPPYLYVPEWNLLIYTLDSVKLSGAYYKPDQLETIRKLIEDAGKSNKINKEDIDKLRDAMDSFQIDGGFIDNSQLKNIGTQLRDLNNLPNLIKIAVMHHNITGFGAAEIRFSDIPFNVGDIKHYFYKNKFSLVLHGHKHNYNVVHEIDLVTKESLYAIGAGTLTSYGVTAGFNKININLEQRHVYISPYIWDDHQFTLIPSKEVNFCLETSPFINTLQIDEIPFLNIFIGKLRELSTDYRQAQKYIETMIMSLKARLHDSGIDLDFLNQLNDTMKDKKFDKLYFTDSLGASVWLNPEFSLHLAQQIWHYTKKNTKIYFRKKTKEPYIGWSLKFDRRLNKAIKHCYENATKLAEELKTEKLGAIEDIIGQTRRDRQFYWVMTNKTENEEKERSLYQIARILIWHPDDLYGKSADAIIQLHKIVNIPLFYIPYEKLSESELEANCRYEYHVFVSKDGAAFKGRWYDKNNPERNRIYFNKNSIPGIDKPLVNFDKLLEFEHLYLAEHYQSYLRRKSNKP